MIFVNLTLALLAVAMAVWMLRLRLPTARWKEQITRGIAWMLPRDIVYWCVIRAWANATTDEHSNQEVSTVTAPDMLKRWKP